MACWAPSVSNLFCAEKKSEKSEKSEKKASGCAPGNRRERGADSEIQAPRCAVSRSTTCTGPYNVRAIPSCGPSRAAATPMPTAQSIGTSIGSPANDQEALQRDSAHRLQATAGRAESVSAVSLQSVLPSETPKWLTGIGSSKGTEVPEKPVATMEMVPKESEAKESSVHVKEPSMQTKQQYSPFEDAESQLASSESSSSSSSSDADNEEPVKELKVTAPKGVKTSDQMWKLAYNVHMRGRVMVLRLVLLICIMIIFAALCAVMRMYMDPSCETSQVAQAVWLILSACIDFLIAGVYIVVVACIVRVRKAQAKQAAADEKAGCATDEPSYWLAITSSKQELVRLHTALRGTALALILLLCSLAWSVVGFYSAISSLSSEACGFVGPGILGVAAAGTALQAYLQVLLFLGMRRQPPT